VAAANSVNAKIYSSERQNFTRTKPLVLTKNKSLTLFLVWRLKLLKTPLHPAELIAALTTIRSSLRWLQGRASILLQRLNQKWHRPEKESEAVRKGQVLSGDASNTLSWVCEISLIYTLLFI